jgi:uncharacterized protein YbaA (DUF1428 family)
MPHYVDGFVVPVPKKNLVAYRKVTSFPQAVQLQGDEVVVFSWIVYKTRAQRDRINAKVMADPRLADMMNPKNMPFDGKRMFWGGFKTIVEL